MSAQDNMNRQQFQDQVNSGRFYHAAPHHPDPHWPPPGSEFVHVGTYQAAMDRVSPIENHVYPPTMTSASISGRVYPHLLSDRLANGIESRSRSGVNEYSTLENLHPEPWKEYDVFPYTNDVEDEGSTSYLVRSSALRDVRAHAISRPLKR
jgi:hypothetical protein